MKIATLLFTYNRSNHTKQTIEALKQNTVLPQKLFLFQDGMKQGEDASEWEKVNVLIHNVDWCDKEIVVSEHNKGLAESIVSGINYVFEKYDAVIVLEDDCVSAPNFIRFMEQCFEKYEDEKKVYSVSGYSWPIELEAVAGDDIYFCGRISSWGWGTWKDRWSVFEKDYELIKKMKQEVTSSRDLATWGQDLEEMLLGNVRGTCDSWAVFWALNVIKKQGLCINTYQSLIRNIGLDGSGVHCDETDNSNIELDMFLKEGFDLTDNTEISNEVKAAFADLYGSYTVVNECTAEKEKMLVYGLGKFFLRNEKGINEKYYIDAFIDNGKKGYHAGKRIVKAKDVSRLVGNDTILIMIQDINECMKAAKDLVCKYGIDADRIKLGCQYYGAYKDSIENIRVLKDGKWEITLGGGSFMCCKCRPNL